MSRDPFADLADDVSGPARRCLAVQPSDTGELTTISKALYVGGAGDVILRAVDDGSDTVFSNVVAGTILPVRVRAVRAAGTTASAIVALV